MKVIVFDVDGVLIKSKDEHGKYLWHKNIQRDLGLNPDQMRKIYSGGWHSVTKGLLDAQQYFKNMFAELNVDLSVDVFIDYWLKQDLVIDLEMLSEVSLIKGPKLYIGTNQESIRTNLIQKKFGSYFDGIFSSCQVGANKPDLEFFRHIESALNVKPGDIAFIDDSRPNIEAALQCGWNCHHYQDFGDFRSFIRKL